MELVVAFLVIIFVLWLLQRHRAVSPPQAKEQPAPDVREAFPATEQKTRDSIWISSDEASALLSHLSPGDDLPITIENGPGGRLPTSPEGKYFAPGNRELSRLGLHWLNVRGTGHYQDQRARVMIRPGDHVLLHREPGNEHDPNAIAVQREGLTLGYINKGLAKRLAKRLDSGEQYRAVALRMEPLSIMLGRPEILTKLDLN